MGRIDRCSTYRDDEPSPTALEARDGSSARYHIAILVGDPPGVMSRTDPGYDGPYATPHVLSDWGELILATLRLPTRRENGAPSVRRFSASEVETLRGRFSEVPTAVQCVDLAEEGALSWRTPA